MMHVLCLILPLGHAEPAPNAGWSFNKASVEGTSIRSDVPGGRTAGIEGRARIINDPVQAIVLDGSNWINVGTGETAGLPADAITVEAWAAIDRPQQWGGIVSALQDNGDFEKGWMLGFKQDMPCFALSTTGTDDGNGQMTYLVSSRPFVPGQLHHIVGTWDGTTQRLYMDGDLVGTSTVQSGPVLYPDEFPLALGTYRDENEHYPMAGLLQKVVIWDGAMPESQVASNAAGLASEKTVEVRAVSLFDSGHIIQGSPDKDGIPPRPDPMIPVLLDATAPDALAGSYRVVDTQRLVMPVDRFSVEALLSLDRPLPEGGVLAWSDEDGRGWILGQQDGRIGFRITGEDGSSRWLLAPEPFEPGAWHHVVASYDGASTRLFIDGQPVAFTRDVVGPISVPTGAPLTIGGRTATDSQGAVNGRLFMASLLDGELKPGEVADRAIAARDRVPPMLVLQTSASITPIGKAKWQVTWETQVPGPSSLDWGTKFPLQNHVESTGTGTRHDAVLVDVPADRIIRLRINGSMQDTRPFIAVRPSVRPGTKPPEPVEPETRRIEARTPVMEFDSAFDYTGRGTGYILVWGIEDGRRACGLARRHGMQVIAIDDDPDRVRLARDQAESAGLYGTRVRVHLLEGEELPYANYLFDHVTTERGAGDEPFTSRQNTEMWRVVRPAGGIYEMHQELMGPLKSIPIARKDSHLLSSIGERNGRKVYTRAALPKAGDWTHQYGDAANTACSEDDLVKGDMSVLWWGRPGPRPMMDRGGRTPAPLMANGRMFIQANRQLIAVNAYNGAILWSTQLPELRRVNVPRDCSNMVAGTDDLLYVAIDDRLWVIDAATGRRVSLIDVPVQVDEPLDWGYIGRVNDHILGSGVRPGSTYTGAEGEWYDAGGVESWRVTSDVLFSLDASDHDLNWSHVPRGRLLNSTITVDGEYVYYIETRDPAAGGIKSGRLGHDVLHDQFLVAFELETGHRAWETPIDIDHFDRMTYLLHANGSLVVVGTSDKFHVLVFNADDGTLRWRKDHAWDRDHHGGPLQHPVVVANDVYIERLAYDLDSGEVVHEGIPQGRGCGTKTASNHLFFFRHYFHSFWDPDLDLWTEWTGTRGGCWLGMLPVGGIVLAPESSSGCSCTHAIQTSMAFIPRGTDPTLSRTVTEQ